FFFFSSRRRHTRSKRDWSSDVCSSDLFKGRASRRRQSQSLPARRAASPPGTSALARRCGGRNPVRSTPAQLQTEWSQPTHAPGGEAALGRAAEKDSSEKREGKPPIAKGRPAY